MNSRKLTLKAGAGATKISLEDAVYFFGKDAILDGEKRGDFVTVGPWSIIKSYKAIATTATWKNIKISYKVIDEYTLHGERSMFNIKQSGYNLEGRVSIDNKKHSCFTSSILFELPDGKLIDVAVIHARS